MEETQSSSQSKTWVIGVIVVVLLVIGGYVVMSRSKTTTNNVVPPTNSTGSTTKEGVMEVTVNATEFAFSPGILLLKVGQPVRLTLKNNGKMTHDFIVDEIAGATTDIIAGGKTTTIEFTPTLPGTFKFYCSVGNHRAQGMEGTVTVQ